MQSAATQEDTLLLKVSVAAQLRTGYRTGYCVVVDGLNCAVRVSVGVVAVAAGNAVAAAHLSRHYQHFYTP